MNLKNLSRGIAALLPAILLGLCSCSPETNGDSKGDAKGQGGRAAVVQPGVPGGIFVETHKESATVTAVDKATRKVTLLAKDGSKEIVTAGPEVANFNQIEVGDRVNATVTEQLVVYVRKPGEASSDGAAVAVALAPLGAKPGALMANTVEVTAKVESIDVNLQKATLRFPDGTTRTFKVRKDVDLTKQTVGSDVVIRTTEAVAILVEKP